MLLQTGQESRKKGDLVAAERALVEGLRLCPGDRALLMEFAEVTVARRDWPAAALHWKEVLDACGSDAPARVFGRTALSLRNAGDLAQAEQIASSGLDVHRGDPSLLRELARLAIARKNWTVAARRWQQVTESLPMSSEAGAAIARSYRNLGDLTRAESALREARELYPEDVRLLAEQTILENYGKPIRGRAAAAQLPLPQVDIVVCVYNAFEETRACLEALASCIDERHFITIVDDASKPEVRAFLREYVTQSSNRRMLINETNQGYTKSANRGLMSSRSGWVLLLNSDTVVIHGWLDRLLNCAVSDPKIRAAGPWSNAATFQSLPWAADALAECPGPETLGRVAERVREVSEAVYPNVPLLNGFCLLLHKPTLDEVGYLDEVNFPKGYGEENDLCLRLLVAGHKLAIADDAFVYHSGSASFGMRKWEELTSRNERLKRLWPGYSYRYISELIQEMPVVQNMTAAGID